MSKKRHKFVNFAANGPGKFFNGEWKYAQRDCKAMMLPTMTRDTRAWIIILENGMFEIESINDSVPDRRQDRERVEF